MSTIDKSKYWILDEINYEGISEKSGHDYYSLRFTNCETKESYWTYADQGNRNFKKHWYMTCHNNEYGVYTFNKVKYVKKSRSKLANKGCLLSADSSPNLVELAPQDECKDLIMQM